MTSRGARGVVRRGDRVAHVVRVVGLVTVYAINVTVHAANVKDLALSCLFTGTDSFRRNVILGVRLRLHPLSYGNHREFVSQRL